MDFIQEHGLIKIFQESFSFPIVQYNKGNNKTITLRHNLIKEESEETEDGISLFLKNDEHKDESLIQIADGLGDTGVVVLGTLHTFDLPLNLELGKTFSLKIEPYVSFTNNTSVINYLLDNYIKKEYDENISLEDYHGALNLMLLEIDRLWNIYLPNISYTEIYKEIHRSNMSKACDSEETALKTIAQPQYKEVSLSYNKIDDKYFVRRSDNKLIKSIDYSPANLKPIIFK